jgi:hypothetical protein
MLAGSIDEVEEDFSKWEIEPDEVKWKEKKVIGRGSFGVVSVTRFRLEVKLKTRCTKVNVEERKSQ